jgi:hypothetical protein
VRPRGILWGALLAAGLAGAPGSAEPLERGQRACVLELNKSGAAVAETQAGETLYCLEQAARGEEPDPQACLAADGRGKLARSLARLAARGGKRCKSPLPAFGYSDPAALGDHAVAEATGLAADLFGPDLTASAAAGVSAGGSACQSAVAKGSEQILAVFLQRARKAKAGALGDRAAPAASADAVAEALVSALGGGADAKLERSAEKAGKRTGEACGGAALGTLFPGTCAGAADAAALAACADARARCRACRALAAFDVLPLDCDALDDGTSNDSCTKFELPFFPPLVASSHTGPGEAFSPTRWPRLEFAGEVPPERLEDLALRCDGLPQEVRALPGQGATLFIVPAEPLPANASCELHWPASDGSVGFATGASSPVVLYDRSDTSLFAPFPDDALLVDDPLTATGKRIALPVPPFQGLLLAVAQGISSALSARDGFSPQQPLVLALSAAVDPTTIPLDEAASLEPGASIRLVDVDPASPDLGERIPFVAIPRSDAAGPGRTDHSVILLPALDLREGGHYALVVTRDAHSLGGGPFGPSGFFELLLSDDAALPATLQETRAVLAPLLEALANDASPPLLASDLALAVGVSVRSRFSDPSDWVSVKEQVLAAPPVVLVSSETEDRTNDVVHRGSVELPLWIAEGSLTEVTRDGGGAPTSLETDSVPFVLRIPKNATTPMPIVIYQHGSPGSPEEILGGNSNFLIDAGYAMLGIQDFSNRRFGQDISLQITETVGRLAFIHHLPLTNFQSQADMMALLRAIQGMGQLGNFPEIDPTRILFRGISFGAHHSLGFLPFAPEVTAAASHVGSGRLFHTNLHQLDYNGLLDGILQALPGSRPRDVIAGFAAVQNEQDRDDSHLLARFLYREPLAIAGLADTTPPSLLWIEGIGDSLVPNVGTRASAVELGIPTVRPVPGPSPVLTEVDAPLSENLAAGVTAGHFQYDPLLTPSCVAIGQEEGHFCAQGADEVDAQVLHFYATALSGAAEIIDPFP